MIRARVNGCQFVNILCDSGSSISCIDSAYAEKLGTTKFPLEPGDLRNIVLADSASLKLNSKVRLKIEIGGVTTHHWFYCVPKLSHSILVGLDYMRKNKINLLHATGMLSIYNVRVPFVRTRDYLGMATLRSSLKIPGRTERVVKINANSMKKQIPAELKPLSQPIPGLSVGKELWSEKGYLCVVSYNHSDYPIRLVRNMPIGYVVKSTEKVVITPQITLPTKNEKENCIPLPQSPLVVSATDPSVLSTDRPVCSTLLTETVPKVSLAGVASCEKHQSSIEPKPLARLMVNIRYLSSDALDSTPVHAEQPESITEVFPSSAREGCIDKITTESCEIHIPSSLSFDNNCDNANVDVNENVHAMERSVDLMHDQTANQCENVANVCAVDRVGVLSNSGCKNNRPTNEFIDCREAAAACNNFASAVRPTTRPSGETSVRYCDAAQQTEPITSSAAAAPSELSGIGDGGLPPQKRTCDDLGIKIENTNLSEDKILRLKQLIENYNDVFNLKNSELSGCNLGTLKLKPIDENVKPFRSAIYPQNAENREEIERQVSELLKDGFIERSTSPFSSSAFLVAKAGSPSKRRLVFDYRRVNRILEQDAYVVPTMSEIIDKIASKKPCYFTSLDLSASYNQVILDESSRKYTGFSTYSGSYVWKRAAFGLVNSGAALCRLASEALCDDPRLFQNICIYIDDILLYTDSYESHMELLELLFQKLRKANFKVSPSKTKFCLSAIKYIGHEITPDGIKADPDRIAALLTFPSPRNKRELKRILGAYQWVSKHLKGYPIVAKVLQELLKKDRKWEWTEREEKAHQEIKTLLANTQTLYFPDETETGHEYYLSTDASNGAVAYCLTQMQTDRDTGEKREVLIACSGKSLTASQKLWSALELETLAVLLAVNSYRHYFTGRRVIIRTDNMSVRWLQSLKRSHQPRLYRWSILLGALPNVSFEHIAGSKNFLPDALSRRPYPPTVLDEGEKELIGEDTTLCSIDSLFEDEGEKELIGEDTTLCSMDSLFEDGWSSLDSESETDSDYAEMFDGESIGLPDYERDYQIISDADSCVSDSEVICTDDFCTATWSKNIEFDAQSINKAEVGKAVGSAAVKAASACGSNNDFAPEPISGKESSSPPYTLGGAATAEEEVFLLSSLFEDKPVEARGADYVTAITDSGVTSAVEADKPGEVTEGLRTGVIFGEMDIDLREYQLRDEYLSKLIRYIEEDILPEDDEKLRRKIMTEGAFHYLNADGVLCKGKMPKRKDHQADDLFEESERKVVPVALQTKVLDAYHRHNHCGLNRLGAAILRNFAWDKFYSTAKQFLAECTTCMLAKRNITPKALLGDTLVAQYPNHILSIDLITGLNVTSRGNQYIVSLIDHFTRMVFLHPVPSMRSEVIAEALLKCISFTTCPVYLLSDMAPNLLSNVMQDLYKILGIQKIQSLPYKASCLGTLERYHKTMGDHIRCLLCDYPDKDWEGVLDLLQLSYRTCPAGSSKISPFELWTGRPPRLPIDLSLGVALPDSLVTDGPGTYIEKVKKRLELMFKVQTECDKEAKEERKKRYNATRARPVDFKVGSIVFLSNSVLDPGIPKKLHNNYTGPFKIEEILSPHVVKLRDLKTDKVLSSRIHVDRLKLGRLKGDQTNSSTESVTEVAAKPAVGDEPINSESLPAAPAGEVEQDAAQNVVPIELILAQKGQGPSLRYRVKPCLNPDGSRNQSYWIRADLVDQDLKDKFYEKHTKSGKIRKRV